MKFLSGVLQRLPNNIYILVALLVGLTTLGQIIFTDGWPRNHEHTSFFLRTIVYAEHMLQGDYLPIWSSTDNNGMGSPQPLFYHKLFYIVSGVLYAWTGFLKSSIIVGILIFLLIGCYGMYILCIECGCQKKIAFLGSLIIIISNYTITNWLIRGAMAEFSACMLLPLALALYLRLANKKNYINACFFGVVIAFLFLAHSVMAFYVVLFLFIITFLLLSKEKDIKIVFLLVCSIAFFFLIVTPYLYTMFIFFKDYNLSRIIPEEYRPENRFMPLTSYFWDTLWIWGNEWNRYTVQFDLPIIILLVVMGGVALYKNIDWKSIFLSNSTIMLGSLIILCLLLQCKMSTYFYKYFPGAEYLQFPWRLLGILTPCLIVVTLLACQYLLPKFYLLVSYITTITMFISSGAYVSIKYERIVIPHTLNEVVFSAFHEYQPNFSSNINKVSVIKYLEEQGCKLSALYPQNWNHESLFVRYKMIVKKSGIYPLPLYASNKHKITIYKANQITNSLCKYVEAFPGLCGITLDGGDFEVLVEFPRLIYRYDMVQ